MIPYGKQIISEDDINSVIETLQSDFLTQGPKVSEFEEVIAKYCNVSHAVSYNSATSALHASCLALGIAQDDWVWTSPISFVASANCALYCGGKVDFIDINPLTLNIDLTVLEAKLEQAKKDNRLPKVIIPVHMAGQSCEMKNIYELSKTYGFKIIEDASHAIGGEYLDTKVGSCKYSDITVFSFHPVKIITTGEGGIATTNSESLKEKLKLFCSHGITRDIEKLTNKSEGTWYYEQVDLGFNYRLTDLQASLGISQLKNINNFVKTRNILAENYGKEFEKIGITTFPPLDGIKSSYHLYIIKLGQHLDRKKVFNQLRNLNIGVNVHYIPIPLQPYYKSLNYSNMFKIPSAISYYNSAITIPLHAGLKAEEQEFIITKVKEVVRR